MRLHNKSELCSTWLHEERHGIPMEQCEVGTEYHEAFHYVFLTLLNDKERRLYKEPRKKFNLPNATELELEEAMAEDFRDYVFTAATADTIGNKILKFFKDIFNSLSQSLSTQ